MNRLKLWIVAALAAALALSMIAGVSAQPRPPLVFEGTVTDPNGDPAPPGLDVQAYVNNTDCTEKATTTYQAADGTTRYFVRVAKASQIPGCAEDGDKVSFRIGGDYASETGTFDGTKARIVRNLTLTDGVVSAVNISVAVWRQVEDPFNPLAALAISTKAPGGGWVTHPGWPLTMSLSESGNWYRSELTPLSIELSDGSTTTIDVAIWRKVSTPTSLAISTKAPGGGWVTHPGWPLEMSLSESGKWYRSELTTVAVELQ